MGRERAPPAAASPSGKQSQPALGVSRRSSLSPASEQRQKKKKKGDCSPGGTPDIEEMTGRRVRASCKHGDRPARGAESRVRPGFPAGARPLRQRTGLALASEAGVRRPAGRGDHAPGPRPRPALAGCQPRGHALRGTGHSQHDLCSHGAYSLGENWMINKYYQKKKKTQKNSATRGNEGPLAGYAGSARAKRTARRERRGPDEGDAGQGHGGRPRPNTPAAAR